MSWINEVIKINDNLYCIKDVQSVNKYLIIGMEKALLFDTGFGFVDFRPLVREITNRELIVVNSHADLDHVLGNYLFEEVYLSRYDYKNLQINEQPELKQQQLAHRLNKPGSRLAEEMGDPQSWLAQSIYKPTYHLIDAGFVFDLGNLQLEVIALPGHSSGSIALLERNNGWMFTGDSIMEYNVFYMPAGNPPRLPEPMMVYYDSLLRVKTRMPEISFLYPGHGPFNIGSQVILDTIANLEEIHSRRGVDEDFITYHGKAAKRHYYGKSLIYFVDEYVEPFRSQQIT